MSRASGYAAATMTVTVKEAVTINSKDYGSTQTFTVASIANITRRVFTATTTEATVMTFSSAMAAGQSIPAKVKYLRFTNLDDTNHIVITFANENDDEAAIKLDAGNTFIFAGDNSGGMADVLDADGSALSLSLGDLKSITVDADTASCDVELFVAETV
tara:strand:- start:213 stop:689 length:477 start_codon:yes stop_codon:yes gene_type:complete